MSDRRVQGGRNSGSEEAQVVPVAATGAGWTQRCHIHLTMMQPMPCSYTNNLARLLTPPPTCPALLMGLNTRWVAAAVRPLALAVRTPLLVLPTNGV